MNAHHHASFMLGEIKVSPSHNTLWAGDHSLKLQPKAMAVLHYLACNQHRVISNEEMIEQLWAGRVVTHGSVQKSINALRSALNELIGENDLIAHYSKRGYQLMVEPQFLAPPIPEVANEPGLIETPPSNAKPMQKWHLMLALAIALVAAMALYKGINRHKVQLPHHHQTVFHSTQGYTNETGHERSATPHPDNQHLAYIRETIIPARTIANETASEIVIRNAAGKDWRIASSNGTWFKLAWSPAGKNLVAIEAKQRDGLPLGTRFYQPANYLYSFHIFALDLAQEQLLEKQQLSQWQGHIFSVSWWDENTLEIVAKQGPNSGNGRYRYSLVDQQLTLLDELENITNPVASAVFDRSPQKMTAIASLHKNKIQIDFLDAQQERINRTKLDIAAADISWIPDGSGVLVYAEDERKLFTVYLDGQQTSIPLADSKDKNFSRPRYSADGGGIFYTEEKRSANIILTAADGTKHRLTENTDFNYAASFSPTGEKLVYASVRNNQIHLWLIENGQERQLTQQPVPKKVDAIIWSDNGEHIVFNADNQLYHLNLLTNESSLLMSDTNKIEPIAYFPGTNRLFAIKYNGDVRNLWRIEGSQQKQLTFGAVSSAIEYGGDVFFQYVSEKGLWALRSKNDELERANPHLDEYSKLLKADSDGIYYIKGGICQESDIYYQDYSATHNSVFLTQKNSAVLTTSFNPAKGLSQTECSLPEANIVRLK